MVQLGFDIPDEDRTLSPHTGWTRGHWEAVADGLLHAVQRYRTPGQALIDLPGPPGHSGVRSDGLEAFARTFLLAAVRVAGASGEDKHGFLERYVAGVVRGTRSPGREDDPDSWPLIGHQGSIGPIGEHGQPMVESASVALSLHLTRRWSWDVLDSGVQDRIEAWLRGALRHTPAPNNWYLFPVTVANFLESVGRGDAETARTIDRGLTLTEGWYRGEGWYTDGDGRHFDHYVGWAMHLYPMLFAYLRDDQEMLGRFGPRLHEFLESFSLMFDRDGAPLYQGRSLTYRIATGGAVAIGAVTGHTPLAPGVTRRILSGGLRYFLDRGALTEGRFSLGWHGPHQATLQTYNGPGSPYWASKGFLALLLPADDPVWTDVEGQAPAEREDRALAVRTPGFLIQTTRRDGLVRVHNHGSDRIWPWEQETAQPDPLYARFAYSTRTGPTSAANVADNHVSVRMRGWWSVRRRIHPLAGGQNWLASYHQPLFPQSKPLLPSGRIESLTVVRGRLELRVHRLVNVPVGTPIRQTGWAVGLTEPPAEEAALGSAVQAAEVRVAGPAVTTQLAGLAGYTSSSAIRAPQGTAFGPWSIVPAVSGEVGEGAGGTIFVALASLTGEPEPSPLAGLASATVTDTGVDVRWTDGRTLIDFSGDLPRVIDSTG